MKFEHIQGHEKIKKILAQVINTGRLSHAYLFSGPDGIGKQLTAIALSKILLCSSGGLEACGKCSSCIQVDRGTHPDLLMVKPLKGIISIESIRNLKKELSRKSFAGGYKICLIDNAEKMNVQAENSLLKTLEEPALDTVIILITGQPYRLLPTVLSRCQQLKFQPLSISTASELIMKNGNVDAKTASLLASLTGGSPGKALDLNVEHVKELRDSWSEYLRLSGKGGSRDISNLAAVFCGDKESLHLRLNLLRLWYRDMILYKIYGDSQNLLNSDKADEIVSHASSWRLEELVNALFCIENYSQTLDRNVNPQLTMETLFLNLNPGRVSFSPHSGRAFALGNS